MPSSPPWDCAIENNEKTLADPAGIPGVCWYCQLRSDITSPITPFLRKQESRGPVIVDDRPLISQGWTGDWVV